MTGSLAVCDRIEAVRGATGLMTGAGNPSAAINLVRKHATSKELTGSAEAGPLALEATYVACLYLSVFISKSLFCALSEL